MYILMINISHKLFQVSKIRKSDRILGYTRYPLDPLLDLTFLVMHSLGWMIHMLIIQLNHGERVKILDINMCNPVMKKL